MELELAAAACMSNGQIWDISDLAHRKTLPAEGATYTDRDEVEFWHSASFSNDGRAVIFGDESFTGSCNATQENRVAIRGLIDAFELRLLETLRERLGGTYSPGIDGG